MLGDREIRGAMWDFSLPGEINLSVVVLGYIAFLPFLSFFYFFHYFVGSDSFLSIFPLSLLLFPSQLVCLDERLTWWW